MKVALIHPAIYNESPTAEKEIKVVPSVNMPLGILYLGQILKNNGHKINLYDHYVSGKSIDEMVAWVNGIKPDVLGISVLSGSYHTANAIAKKAKNINPNLVIIYGSYLPTLCAPNILKECDFVDFCVRGEGEQTLVELMDALERNGPLDAIKGISYRKNGKIIETPDRPQIKDLDSIPIPDRKLLQQDYKFHDKITSMILSRGCPYNCTFCSCWKYCKGKWRPRSIEHVIEELQILYNDGFREIMFTDDCFNASRKRILKLCYLMRKERLDFVWHCIGRVDRSDKKFLRTMVKAGCKTIYYGIESANQRILDYYRKKATPEQAVLAVKNSKKAGVESIGSGFIIGAPDETKEEILNTVKFGLRLQKLGLTALQFQLLYVTVGTAIYDEYVAKGYLDPEKDWNKQITAVSRSPNAVSASYLEILARRAYRDFMSNTSFVLSEFLKTLRSSYRLRIVNSLLSRANRDV
ncbi:MAG: B12-binding domain-containing radical SAM protein [Candidatus Hodarchaeota archaeon]